MNNMHEYVVLSHNDMDGAGCDMVLGTKFHIDSTIHSNYNEIIQNLKLIDEKLTIHSKVVFITDLSFDENSFIELVRLAMNHGHVKFIYIDHHEYKGRELELLNKIQKMENVFVKHDVTKCATMLCFEFIKSNDADLHRMVRFINAYDIYLEDTPEFKVGYMMNTIFWAIKMNSFKVTLENNNYKIPKKFLEMNKEIVAKKDAAFKLYEQKGLIVKDEDNSILLAFSDDYKSFYQHDYEGYKAYILPYQNSNNISIRLKDLDEAEEVKDSILEFANSYPNTINSGGHPFAFGISIDSKAPKDDVFMLIQGIIEIVSQYTNPDGIGDVDTDDDNSLTLNEDEIPF